MQYLKMEKNCSMKDWNILDMNYVKKSILRISLKVQNH